MCGVPFLSDPKCLNCVMTLKSPTRLFGPNRLEKQTHPDSTLSGMVLSLDVWAKSQGAGP